MPNHGLVTTRELVGPSIAWLDDPAGMPNPLPDVRKASVEQFVRALRCFLEGGPPCSDVELADAIVSYYRPVDDYAVFDERRLWRYEPGRGVFVRMEDAEIANIVYDLDGVQFDGGNCLNATAAKANGVQRIVQHRLTDTGFFMSAPDGVAVTNGFLKLVTHPPEIRKSPMSSLPS